MKSNFVTSCLTFKSLIPTPFTQVHHVVSLPLCLSPPIYVIMSSGSFQTLGYAPTVQEIPSLISSFSSSLTINL